MAKTVLITGATRGIGRACALKFAQQGWNVAACYVRSQEAAQTLAQEMEQCGTQFLCEQADVRDVAALRRVVSLAQAHFGTLDAVVCNAGIAQQKLFSDITEEDWDAMFDVNTKGAYRTIQAALPLLLEQQAGSLVTDRKSVV